jgi:hypothetical protein
MSFSASSADERVLDVQFTDDTLCVSLRDGRTISVPLAWYPRLLNATAQQRPDVDEDLGTEGLLRGAPASKSTVPSQ